MPNGPVLTSSAILLSLALLPSHADASQRSKRAIAEFKREQPCPANGARYGPCPGWQIDHIIPLKCDGPDHKSNMQWLTVREHKQKTKREARLCRR